MSKPFVNLHLTRPLILVDCETTGVSPKIDRIVEVAAVKFMPDGQRLRFCRRINPLIPIPAASTAVHAITDQDVAGCPSFADIAAPLSRFLRDADWAGFGIKRFDLPFLLAEFRRAEIHFSLAHHAVLDVLQIYHQREPRDLTAAVRHYLDRPHENAHGALADAYAAAAVLDAQLACYPDLPQQVTELHAHLTDADLAGKLRRERGRLVLTFGKHSGRELHTVAQQDPDYLRWLLEQDFLPDFEAMVQIALQSA
jgi:DNA polymerase-3 subunit epsilon